MDYDVRHVEVLNDYRLFVELENGQKGVFDMNPFLNFGAFSELKNVSYFKQVDIVFGALSWPNGQDIEPNTLAENLQDIQQAS